MVVSRQQLAAARGVVRFSAPPAELEEAARALGRYCVLLEGTEVEDKAGFLELCQDAFGLPEWFGHNWDALEESLADLPTGRGADGTVVIWTDWALFAESDPEEYATALDVFEDTARTLGVDGVPFVVLRVGEGPDEADEPDMDLELDDIDPDEPYDEPPGGEES